jgi:hypothetical protein
VSSLWASKTKAVVDIAATAFLWIEHTEYDQYRPALPFDMLLVIIHLLLYSFLFFMSPKTNDGVSVN